MQVELVTGLVLVKLLVLAMILSLRIISKLVRNLLHWSII